MIIREETPEDICGIRIVNKAAFEQNGEADLVDLLRDKDKFILSLIAEVEGQIVGHILFTPAKIVNDKYELTVAGLAPMAVLPKFQKRGIGKELVKAGLEKLKETKYDIVIVLGHPEYYPKFGFEMASVHGIKCEFNVPDEVFMVLELKKEALKDVRGIAKYQSEFNDLV